MFIKHLNDCADIIAGDNSILKELLHPKNDNIPLKYSLAYAKVLPGKTTLPHVLEQAEVYYILKGTGRMTIGIEFRDVKEGDVIYVPPKEIQYIQNKSSTENLEFLCIVNPEWSADREKVITQ